MLYKKIIRKKYDDYSSVKNGTVLANYSAQELHKNFIKRYNKIQTKLAVKLICPQIMPTYILEKSEIVIINAIGICTISDDGNTINFVHKTYAEYYVANFIYEKLTDEVGQEILDFLLNDVPEFDEIKRFLNQLIYKTNFSEIFLKKIRDSMLKYFQRYEANITRGMMCICINDNDNLLKILYEAIKLLEPTDLINYRKFCPDILSYSNNFLKNSSFLERVIEENSVLMQYNLTQKEYLKNILQLDSITVLDKLLKTIEQQVHRNSIRDYLTSTYPNGDSCLFYLKTNCSNYFLDYLKKFITPIEDFKKFALITHTRSFLTGCSEEVLIWFKGNVSNEFYNLLVGLKNSPLQLKSNDEMLKLIILKHQHSYLQCKYKYTKWKEESTSHR